MFKPRLVNSLHVQRHFNGPMLRIFVLSTQSVSQICKFIPAELEISVALLIKESLEATGTGSLQGGWERQSSLRRFMHLFITFVTLCLFKRSRHGVKCAGLNLKSPWLHLS